MALGTIIWLVLVIIAALVIWKVTKSIMKGVFLALSFGALIVLIVCGLIVSDTMNFKEKFPAEPSLYLFEVDGEIEAGFSAVLSEEDFTPEYMLEELITSLNKNYKEDNLKPMLGENYKLFVVKKQVLDVVEEIPGQDFSKQDADKLLVSDTPIDDFIKMQIGDVSETQLKLAREQVFSQIGVEKDSEFKAAIFGSLFAAAIEQEGPVLIFEEYKEGNIVVYKETMMFKFMKKIPNFLLKSAIKVQGE